MSGTWTGPAFMDALKVALDATPGLANANGTRVAVYTGPLGNDTPLDLVCILGATGGEEPYKSFGRGGHSVRQDNYSVPCIVGSKKPGASEAARKSARDRANALFICFDTVLTADPSLGVAEQCYLSNVSMQQGAESDSMWCIISFDIRVQARI